MKQLFTNKLLLFTLSVLMITCATVGQAPMISIPITDPDFESQTITGYVQTINDPAGCGTAEQGLMAGWKITDLVPGAGRGVAHWTCNDGMPNSNVAFLLGAAMDQVLTEKPRQGVYVLQFDVANWFYPYPGDWNAALYQGDSPAPLCTASGWAEGDMKRITVTCPVTGYLIEGGADPMNVAGQATGNLRIHFQNGVPNPALGNHAGWPILIDNVSLSFSPSS